MIKFDKLEKLAAFLDGLPSAAFDFTVVRDEKKCGAVGCAIGWTPSVFPDEVGSTKFGVVLHGKVCMTGEHDFRTVAQQLFGVSRDEADALFNADSGDDHQAEDFDCPWNASGHRLSINAGPRDVAGAIRRYVAWKRGGGK